MSEQYLGNPLLKKANTQQEFTKEQVIEFYKCAADPVYFELYYNLWIGQLKKYYPEYDKLIALYKPTEEIIDRCKKESFLIHKATNIYIYI